MSLSRGTLRGYLEKHLSDPHLVNLLCDAFPDGTTPLFGLACYSLFLDYYYLEGGTGAPATAVSGVGAANMVLRDLHRREYARRT